MTPMAKSNRDYKDEYQKFGSSLEAKKKRACLNRLKDCPKGQDNSHQPGAPQSVNPPRTTEVKREEPHCWVKTRLPKESEIPKE